MRIRKLLGCASERRTAPSPQKPSVAAVPAAAAEVMENANEDGEEGMSGVVKNGFEAGEKEEDGIDEKAKDKEEDKDEKGKARRRWRREKISEEVHAVTKCKKTDGKGWHCKRAAQHPHSLCSYHLAQLRSYRSRFEVRVSGGRGNRRRKPAAAMEAGGGISNYRYYYALADEKAGHRALADNGGYEVNGDGGRFSGNERRVEKKRGRKPVKARSLKSLL